MLKGRVLTIVVAFGLMTVFAVQATSATARPLPCNGSSALCDRPFNEVTLPGTHNSMSNAELDWTKPNQTYSMPNQLARGARAMLIDTYYGRLAPNGKQIENVVREDRDLPGVDTYLCHATCLWGSVKLVEELGRVRDFLAANPREAMLFVNEANITPADFAEAVEKSGLIDFVYTGSTTGQWPTLGQMVTSGKRVVMLSEGNTGDVPWYHNAYAGTLQETPYSWPAMTGGLDKLTNPNLLPDSCVPNRGGTTGSLFLMNHWISGNQTETITPDPAAAEVVNQKGVVVNRARACEQRRGIKPTILAVDFFGAGDVVDAARELNGVVAAPFLRVGKPKRAVVRAGRRATFRVPISNVGDADATGIRVCAKVPKRIARKPRCLVAKVPVGLRKAVRVNVRTKKRRRGAGKVKITVRAQANNLSVTTRLRVKPIRRR